MNLVRLNFDEAVVLNFHNELLNDPFHRFRSWEHCYTVFKTFTNKNILSLNLAFYLASWGMYRGSGGLLQKDYKIHEGAIDILKGYKSLRCLSGREFISDLVDHLMEVSEKLKDYYSNIKFYRSSQEKNLAATDTLISKILLGAFGCCPAFDRYFISGAKAAGISLSNFNRNSIDKLLLFIECNKRYILSCQKKINQNSEVYYPLMKVIDMHFWQIGFNSM